MCCPKEGQGRGGGRHPFAIFEFLSPIMEIIAIGDLATIMHGPTKARGPLINYVCT